jgi:hypothetical protein
MSQAFGIYQVCCMMVLVPTLGLLGAALATGTYHLFRNLCVWWNVRHDARWLNVRAVLGYTAVIWGGAVLACYDLKRMIGGPPLLTMGCGVVVCALAGLLYVRSPALSRSDRDLLGQLFHGREAWVLEKLGLLRKAARI